MMRIKHETPAPTPASLTTITANIAKECSRIQLTTQECGRSVNAVT
ncbi:MAG TPA: hypothetical protein PLH12_00705 [Pseudomonadales bacterium]|nr:hypothetical protein [Pseudomonadales bacterium]